MLLSAGSPGVLVPEGVVVVVEVDDGELDVAGVVVVVVSTFLPQAPSASTADRAIATEATDFNGVVCM